MDVKNPRPRSIPYLRIASLLILLVALVISGVLAGIKLTHAASSEPELYQVRTDGSIWAYTGSGWQQLGSANSQSANLVASPGNLFQLHTDGSIWRYTGTPLTGWQQYDTANGSKAISISIQGKIYQSRDSDGKLLVFLGVGAHTAWHQLDINQGQLITAGPEVIPTGTTCPVKEAIGPDTNGMLYAVRSNGVWLFCEKAWQQIDTYVVNGYSPTFDVKATLNGKIYQLRSDSTNGDSIWMYTGGTSWQQIDNAQNPAAIRVDGNNTLYQLAHNGIIWSYNGSSWTALPANPDSSSVRNFKVSKSGDVFETLQDKSVWAYQAGAWQQIDNSSNTLIITTDSGDTAVNFAG